MCIDFGSLYQDPRNDKLVADLAADETSVSTHMRGGLLFLQTMIGEGYLDADRTFVTSPNTKEETSYFSERNCTCISSICRVKASSHDYPFNVEMTVLPMLPGDVVCVVEADQRSAARYRIRTFRYISIPGAR